MKTTKIEWTDKTWNPVTGCTKLSSGCANCYAETMTRRLKAMGLKKYANGFDICTHPEDIATPLQWKSPHTIFVCSMSDIFHEEVPFDFIDNIMTTIYATPWHKYQILTKRAERMYEYFSARTAPANVWLGVTVENQNAKKRIDILKSIPSTIKFLSCEPLIEELGQLDLTGIDWVIVGGESGPKARPMSMTWVQHIMLQAKEQNTAFFFKQWGTWGSDGIKRNKKANGKLLDGKTIQQMPVKSL